MATQNQDTDVLFDVRCFLYIGNYQQCINEAQKLKVSGDLKLDRDVIVYRAYLAQHNYSVVVSEVKPTSAPQLLELQRLAVYLNNADRNRDQTKLLSDLEADMLKSLNINNHLFLIVAATIYFYEQNYDAALRALRQSDNLECTALTVQILLKMDRVDHARREVKRMHEQDEDHTLTQLATAWLDLYIGGDKYQEAFYIFQELCDKFTSTSLLLNGLAACHMGQGRYQDAEPLLYEALEKDSDNPETLTNLIVLTQHMGKAVEETNRYVAQLKDKHQGHYIVQDLEAKEAEFTRLCANYSPSA